MVPVFVLFLVISGVFLMDRFTPSGLRRALPGSATDIREHYSGSWNGDFHRVLKARLPEEDYEAYAAALGLTTRFHRSKHADIRSSLDMGVDARAWWDPPRSSSTTYFDYVEGSEDVHVLKYSNGTVYVLIASW